MTPHSHLLLDRACRLADSAALPAGQEVAVAGSVARGVADAHSDLQLAFFAGTVPDAEERQRWLDDLEAKDVSAGEDRVTFRFEDTWVEARWRTFDEIGALLGRILDGEVTDHGKLVLVDTIRTAVPLYVPGHLVGWKARLQEYPAALAAKLIDGCLAEVWTLPHVVDARWAPVPAAGRLLRTERLVADLQNLLRILFALNRRWEPDWRWLPDELPELEAVPDDFGTRLDGVLSEGEPEAAARALLTLADETLTLLGEYPGAPAARATVSQSLAAHPAE